MNLVTIVNNGHPIHVASQGSLRLRRGPDGTHQVERGIFLPGPVRVSQMPDGAPFYELPDGTGIIQRGGERHILPPPRQNYGTTGHSPSTYKAGHAVPNSKAGHIRADYIRNIGLVTTAGAIVASGFLAACSSFLVSPSIGTPNPAAPTQAPASAYQGNDQKGAEGNTSYTPPVAPVPNSPPRIVAINASTPSIVGREVRLEAIVDDVDGDPFEVFWDQLKNPDRYAGREYVSSTGIVLQTDGTIATFTPDWPGNYRLQLTVADKDGESTQTIDVLVKFETPPFEIRSVVLGLWGPNNETYMAKPLIDRAKRLGANYVLIEPHYHQATINDNEMKPCDEFPYNPDRWCTPISDSELKEWIRYAKSQGLGVMFKLIIDSDKENSVGGSRITPSNPDLWFDNYKKFVTNYATIAEEEGVDAMTVGNEYGNLFHLDSNWRKLINEVRKVYNGQLTYADDRMTRPEWRQQVEFWGSLDLMGLNSYYRTSNMNNNPTVEGMREFILADMRKVLVPRTKRFGKPLLVTELGRQDYDGANYDWTSPNRIPDTAEQADLWEALFQALYTIKKVDGVNVLGTSAFKYDIRRYTGFPGLGGYELRERPVEKLINIWYTGAETDVLFND